MNEGFIKLYRSLLDWEWYKDTYTTRVFLHLLLNANWEDYRFMGYEVPRGSLVIGCESMAKQLGISKQSVRTALSHLKSTHEITMLPTHRFTIVTIVNWEKYQGMYCVSNTNSNTVANTQLTLNQHSSNTNKEIKEINNLRREEVLRRIFDSYNQQNNLISCKALTKPRVDKINNLLGSFEEKEIIEVISKANNIGWLTGNNDKNWKADFDWLMDDVNFCRVQDGRYDELGKEEKKIKPQGIQSQSVDDMADELDKLYGLV